MPRRHPIKGPSPPRWRMVERFLVLERPLALFSTQIAAIAARRPERPVPAETLADARALMAAARRILSREPVSETLFQLSDAPTWAGLATRLALLRHALGSFRDAWWLEDDRDWLTAEQAARHRAELTSNTRALEQKPEAF